MPDIDAALASFGLALLWAAIIILDPNGKLCPECEGLDDGKGN